MMSPFLEFMDRYDPTFRHRIRGVGDREIAEMEAVYGRPLPESYRAFLRVMGADPAGFELSHSAVSTYSEVLKLLRSRQREDWFFENLRDYMIVARGRLDDGNLVLVDGTQGVPPVGRADAEVWWIESTSLLNLMMCVAYVRYPMQQHPLFRAWAGRMRPQRREAIGILRNLGFEPPWFADDYLFVAERGETYAMLQQQAPDLMSLYVHAPTTAILDEIDAVVGRELDLSTSRVHVLPG